MLVHGPKPRGYCLTFDMRGVAEGSEAALWDVRSMERLGAGSVHTLALMNTASAPQP